MKEASNILKKLTFAAVVVTASLLFGCKAEKPEDSTAKELLLYCGAGIRPPVQEIAEAFESEHGVKVVTDYAGSEVLLSKIKLARRGDLYMPGDKHYVEQAAVEGMILSQQSVCYFVPTILVRKGNPKNIRGLQDLLKNGLKLGLGDAKACAIGRKTKQIFAKNNIAWEDVEKNVAFQSLTVNELARCRNRLGCNRPVLQRARHGSSYPGRTKRHLHGEYRYSHLYEGPLPGRTVRGIRRIRTRTKHFQTAQLPHRASAIASNFLKIVLKASRGAGRHFPCDWLGNPYNACVRKYSDY